jgi:hypothetical protein
MPRRGERHKFPAGIFTGNPLAGRTPDEAYELLRWGNPAREKFTINAPEPLVALGELAQLITDDGQVAQYADDHTSPFLAVGHSSNLLYIVPRPHSRPLDVPHGPYVARARLKQTDYYSDKGGEESYYYHRHERPYPTLYYSPSGVGIIAPANHKGMRSFAVAEGGIVG